MPLGSEIARLYVALDADGRPYVKGLRQIDTQTTSAGKKLEAAWAKYGKAAGMAIAAGLAAGTAALVSVGKATVKAAASFEYEMSRIKANANATDAELQALTKTVIQLGKDTVFSAGQTAQAANELVKAGMSIEETIGALPGMLALASAGELSVAQAAEITANQLKVFGLQAEDASQVADALALAANRSTTDVSELGLSLAMSASIAAQAGMTIQETAAALALLANNGLKGSDAGTSLKTMLMMLMAPTDQAARLMKQYGIEIYDASGHMKSMDQIIEELDRGLSRLSEAEANHVKRLLLGQDAIRAGNILIKEGADAYRQMRDELSKSGAAQEIAATKMDNLAGSWEQLKGSVETLAISLGTKLLPEVRKFVDRLTEIVNEALETGDWSALGEELGQLIGEGIQMATPYIVEAMEAAAKAGARAIPLAITGALTDAPAGSEFERMKDYVAEQMATEFEDLPRHEAFVRALEKLQAYWSTSLNPLENRSMWVPKAKSADEIFELGRALGIAFTDEELRRMVELGVDAEKIARYQQEQIEKANAQLERQIRGEPIWSGGALWQPGQNTALDMLKGSLSDVGQAASEAAAGAQDLNEALSETPELSEEAQRMIEGLSGAVANMLSDQEALNKATDDGRVNLKKYLKQLQEQLDIEAQWEENLRKLAVRFPEYSDEVIQAAAEKGPEFVAALAGADDKTARSVLDTLQEIITRQSDEHIKRIYDEIETLQALSATEAGKSAAEQYIKGFSDELMQLPSDLRLRLLQLGPALRSIYGGLGKAAGDATAEEIIRTFAGQGQTGGLAPTTASVWQMVKSIFPGAVWMGGYATSGHIPGSDHYTGHAFDVGGSPALMRAIANLLASKFEDWGIKYIIYNRQAYRGHGWVPYRGSNPHTDHVHVSTYATGGWVLPPPQRSTGPEVPAILHAGEYVLTQNQAEALFGRAPRFAEGGWVMPESVMPSYISRERARYQMYVALSGDFIDADELANLVGALGRQIEFLDEAVAEAQKTLDEAKAKGTQGQINEAAENLFRLREEAAQARQEMERLSRVPLEQAVRRWSSAISQFQTMFNLAGYSSQALSLQAGLLPSLMGSLGGQYQTYLDLMNASTNPQDIIGYGSDAIATLNTMFDTEQAVINRALSDRLDSISKAESEWQRSWDAQSRAVEDSVERQERALQEQLTVLDKAQRAELQALEDHYDAKLRLLEDSERAITREQERNRAMREVASLEDELRILRGQGYYTEADIRRMRELETQIQERRDELQQQEEAWQREDERRRLEQERDAALERLRQQQEMERIALMDQIEAARRALEAQQEALRQQYEQQQRFFERQREAARQAAQREIDALVQKYAQMMQTVIDQQNQLLNQAFDYHNAGYVLGQQFAQGLIDALPLIQQAAQAAAQTAANYLQLHSPAKLGPLAELDRWLEPLPELLAVPLKRTDLSSWAEEFAGTTRNVFHHDRVDIYLHADGPDAANIDLNVLANKLAKIMERNAYGRSFSIN